MIIVDAHLDMAYSAIRFGRDLRHELSAIRKREQKLSSRPNGTATVSLPELRQAGVGLVFATLFAMPESANKTLPDNRELVYADAAEAYEAAGRQLDYYQRLADEEEDVRLVGDAASLEVVVASHQEGDAPQLGLVPLMEGADAVRDPQELEEWYERGVRLIGPAWDDTRYAHGAWRTGGGFTKEGFELMEVMTDLGFVLDLTHLSEQATYEALERYEAVVVATHSNARALVPGQRQLSDDQIRMLAERDGVVGVVLYNRFLKEGYSTGDSRTTVSLEQVVAHIDHICQLLGDARHVGIGSDFDGGFGREHIPAELDSVAGLPLLIPALEERGYGQEDIEQIMGGNWIACLRRAFS